MRVAERTAIQSLRRKLGLTQKVMSRLIGVTERTLIDLEGGREPSETVRRRTTELQRLTRELLQVMRSEPLAAWLTRPNTAFDGDIPADLIAQGKVDLVWKMIFELRSGVAS